jgi:uncharacterized protein
MARHSFSVTCDVAVPMRDGVKLRADIWQPTLPGRRPAILFRTPYDRSRLASDFFSPHHAVANGFVAVVQDTRGRFASEGDWAPFDWQQEGRDTYDSVEWAAAQPWCTDAVGMAGTSFLGIVQLAGVALRPPHLKAIAPAMASVAKHERAEHGGAVWLDHLFSWLCLMVPDWASRRRAAGHVFTAEEEFILAKCQGDMRSLMTARPLKTSPLFRLRDFPAELARVTGSAITPDVALELIDLPILATGGWFDFYLRGTIGLLSDASPSADGKRHLIVGPWSHGTALPYHQGQCHFGLAASGAGARLPEQHAAFFRRYLLEEAVEIPRVTYFLINSGQWRTDESWPPPRVTIKRLFLNSQGSAHGHPSDGTLGESAPGAVEPPDEYVYDPDDPPPSTGGRTLSVAGLIPGPMDQTSLALRTDTLTYDSAVLEHDLDLVGPVQVVLCISSSAVDTDFICKLIDVAPTGLALPITDGVVRLQWRAGYDSPTRYVPESVESISMDLAHVAWRVRMGHRLRLQVQSGNFPHLDANLNSGETVGDAQLAIRATNRVHHCAERLSYLDLSVAAGSWS